MQEFPKQELEPQDYEILADVLDAIDPALTQNQRDEASERAYGRDSLVAYALVIGMLQSFAQELSHISPTIMTDLRKRAGAA
jgi:hypothetical protein